MEQQYLLLVFESPAVAQEQIRDGVISMTGSAVNQAELILKWSTRAQGYAAGYATPLSAYFEFVFSHTRSVFHTQSPIHPQSVIRQGPASSENSASLASPATV